MTSDNDKKAAEEWAIDSDNWSDEFVLDLEKAFLAGCAHFEELNKLSRGAE